MKYHEIFLAIQKGNTVHWTNDAYTLILEENRMYIVYDIKGPHENFVRVFPEHFDMFKEQDFYIKEDIQIIGVNLYLVGRELITFHIKLDMLKFNKHFSLNALYSWEEIGRKQYFLSKFIKGARLLNRNGPNYICESVVFFPLEVATFDIWK
jgi:hypothetical protein